MYDTFDAEEGLLTDSVVPKTVKTLSVPLVARYFHPNGFFAGIGVTHVDQEVVRTDTARKKSLDFLMAMMSFFVVDASIGWRFPKRLGIATLTVNNLLNEKFRFFQGDSFREFRDEPSTDPYIPALQAVGRVTLYWAVEHESPALTRLPEPSRCRCYGKLGATICSGRKGTSLGGRHQAF